VETGQALGVIGSKSIVINALLNITPNVIVLRGIIRSSQRLRFIAGSHPLASTSLTPPDRAEPFDGGIRDCLGRDSSLMHGNRF